MPIDVLIQAASLGGFVFAAIVLVAILWKLWDTIVGAKIVPKPLHDDIVRTLTTANAGLRDDLQASAIATGRLADAVEAMGATLTRHDTDVRERLAGLASARRS